MAVFLVLTHLADVLKIVENHSPILVNGRRSVYPVGFEASRGMVSWSAAFSLHVILATYGWARVAV